MINSIPRHFSAFKGEITKYFLLTPKKRFLDLTLGDGGHTEEALDAGCQVVSFDVDRESIGRAVEFLKNKYQPLIIDDYHSYTQTISPNQPWVIIASNFINCQDALSHLQLPNFNGAIVDLGPSQYQVLSDVRGFSFNSENELDMRLDNSMGVKAKDLVNALNEGELRDLFELGDEPFGRALARVIVSQRQIKPITTAKQLADIISKVKHKVHSAIHPATQVFMALRMAVNLERENIKLLLPQLPLVLVPGGIFGVITFHSTEDKLVKDEIVSLEEKNIVSVINKKPFTPSSEELKISLRTRSAKIRLAQKNI